MLYTAIHDKAMILAAHHPTLEEPSVPLISSFIPQGHPLIDDDRMMTKVN